MNESISRNSVAASKVRNWETRPQLGVRWIAWCSMLVFGSLPCAVTAQPGCDGIHVRVLNIRNSTGTVACALFDSPKGFPTEYLHAATNIMIIRVRKTKARCDFEDIAPGTYALAVIHDENMNGKLDVNWLGVPTEGYGFSNDAKGFLGAPSFSAASFRFDGRLLNMTISMHY